MRDFSKVGTAFWTSPSIQGLSDDGKLLALYVITSPHSNAAGAYRLPDGYVMADLEWERERVREGFRELSAKGFATRCDATMWLFIHKHWRHNAIENPNQAKHVLRTLEDVPGDSTVLPMIREALVEYADQFPAGLVDSFMERFGKGSESVPKQKRREEGEKRESSARARGSKVALKTYLQNLEVSGEPFLPESDPIRAWSKGEGITGEMLRLNFLEFKDRYTDGKKLYIDWREVFRKSVRNRWLKLWYFDQASQTMLLTNDGLAAQKRHQGDQHLRRVA